MQLIDKDHTISVKELVHYMLDRGSLVKAVVDIEQEIMIIGVDLHVDAEQELLDTYNSSQSHLWGINLYPDQFGKKTFVELENMINLRPRDNNKTRGVDDVKIRKKITAIVGTLIST